MTDAEMVLAGQLIVFLGICVGAWNTTRLAKKNAEIGLGNKRSLEDLHILVNSRLTQLLESTKIASHATGKAEGVEQQKKDARDASNL